MAATLSLPTLAPLGRHVTRVRKKKAEKETLTPEEQDSLISQIGTGVMSTVGYIGETLDKPGRALRGLLAGQPGELANLIPFSDTAGLTDPAKSVTGRQLFEKAGLLGPNKEGLDWGDALGFGAEVVLDPLNVIALGPVKGIAKASSAASKAIQAANKADDAYKLAMKSGKAVADLQPLADEAKALKAVAKEKAVGPMGRTPLERIQEIADGRRGLIGFKNPLTAWIPGLSQDAHIPKWATGEKASKAAEFMQYGDETLLGQAASLPARLTRHTFTANPFLKNMAGKLQKAADHEATQTFRAIDSITDRMASVSDNLAEMGELKTHELWMELQKKPDLMNAVVTHLGLDPQAQDLSKWNLSDFLTGLGEQQKQIPIGGAKQIVTLRMALEAAKAPENVAALASHYDNIVGQVLQLKDDLAAEYWKMGGSIAPLVDDFAGHVPRRMNPELKKIFDQQGDILGHKGNRGQSMASKARLDPLKDIPGGTPVLQQISKDPLLNMASNPAYTELQAIARLEDVYGVLPGKSEMLAKKLAKMPAEITKTGLYGDILENVGQYSLGLARSNAALSAIHRLVADTAQQQDQALGGIPLSRALEEIGFSAKKKGDELSGVERAMQAFGERMGLDVNDPAAWENWTVPQQFVDTAKKYWSYHTKPKESEGLLKIFDTFNRFWKSGVTLPFPAFHNRNLISGQFTNGVTAYKNAWHGLKMFKRAFGALRGNDESLWRELNQYKVLPEGVAGKLGPILGDTLEAPAVGLDQFDKVLNPMRSARRTKANYELAADASGATGLRRKAAGVKGVAAGLGQWGIDANQYVEALNRASHFAALRDRGWSPAAAAWSAKAAHFDYSTLAHGAEFQKNVLRRVMPFYSFARFNLPFQLGTLLKNPGGATAKIIRVENRLRDEQGGGFVPRWLGQGLAVSTRTNEDGSRQYFVSHGLLPFEEAFNRFAITDGKPDLRRTVENALAMTTPVIQYPAQAVADRQFWSHRPKSNLHQWPFDSENLNDALAQSPLARASSTVRQFTDERKSIDEKLVNFLVGSAKFTDIDAQTISREIRDILKERLSSAPGVGMFSRPFVADEGRLTDEQRKMLSFYSLLLQEAQDAKKKAEKATPRN